jgi:hypothetical protein
VRIFCKSLADCLTNVLGQDNKTRIFRKNKARQNKGRGVKLTSTSLLRRTPSKLRGVGHQCSPESWSGDLFSRHVPKKRVTKIPYGWYDHNNVQNSHALPDGHTGRLFNVPTESLDYFDLLSATATISFLTLRIRSAKTDKCWVYWQLGFIDRAETRRLTSSVSCSYGSSSGCFLAALSRCGA